MKIVATMPVRNEDWVLGCSLRAVLRWVDEVVILDHASTDRTPDICREVSAENPGRVHCFRDDNPEWQEMRHRQFMLDEARKCRATHVALVDADEVLSANLLPVVRDLIAGLPPQGMLQLPWACLARSLDCYYMQGPWFNNWVSSAFLDGPECYWSSSGRGSYDFHHRHPMGRNFSWHAPIGQCQGGLMHLQFVCERRLRAKQALYKMTEVTRWPGREPVSVVDQRYNPAVYQSDPRNYQTAPAPDAWWEPYGDLKNLIEIESEPWQERRCRDLMAEHGAAKFAGLDLFGVC